MDDILRKEDFRAYLSSIPAHRTSSTEDEFEGWLNIWLQVKGKELHPGTEMVAINERYETAILSDFDDVERIIELPRWAVAYWIAERKISNPTVIQALECLDSISQGEFDA